MKSVVVLSAILAMAPHTAIGQPAASPAPSGGAVQAPAPRPTETLGPLYDEYMRGQVAAHNFSGAVLVAKAGAVVFRGAYGAADAATGAQVTPDTRFRIGSITKPFTSMAVMLLHERGKVAFTDSICTYVEACPAAWQPVTVHHLLSHTSGIANFTALPGYQATMGTPTTPRAIVGRVADLPLEFAPGTQYKYSNTGFVLLGMVIEKAAGQPYADFVKANVIDPLGLANTGVETGAAVRGLAVGYTRARAADPASLVPAPAIHMSVPFAAGAMYSTVGDLLALDRAIARRALLKPESWQRMLTPVQGSYAYGWIVSKQPNGRTFVGHDGGIEGFTSSFRRLEEDDLVFIALRNQDAGPNFSNDLVAIALGARYQVPKKRVVATVDPAIYDAYVGEYRLTPTFAITVTRDGARLVTQATGQQPLEVFPESEVTFFLMAVDAQITFVRGADGAVTGLVLRQNGREMPATKVK